MQFAKYKFDRPYLFIACAASDNRPCHFILSHSSQSFGKISVSITLDSPPHIVTMGRPQLYSPRQPDSPSRQLILELARDLEQVRLHNNELKKVRAYERKSFYERLDRLDREKEEVHNAALTAAVAKRDALRLEAEETLQLHLRAEAEERRRKEELERQRREKVEREKAERERREREEAARAEAVKMAQEEERRRKAEEAERARRAVEEENVQRERQRVVQENKKKEQEVERQKAEQEQAKVKAAEEDKKKQQQQQAGQASTTTTSTTKILGAAHRTPEQIAEHQRYLELHQHLKKFRRYMVAETKKNPILKQHMGDMRRTIKKCVGQLVTDDKAANRTPVSFCYFEPFPPPPPIPFVLHTTRNPTFHLQVSFFFFLFPLTN